MLLPQIKLTEAYTGKPHTLILSNITWAAQNAVVEDYGIFKSRYDGPIQAGDTNEWFDLNLNRTISEIGFKNSGRSLFVLHSPEEITRARDNNIPSLHMNHTLVCNYEHVLSRVERITNRPYIPVNFGLRSAKSADDPGFRTVPRMINQIRDALRAGIPLGRINTLSTLGIRAPARGNRPFDTLLKPGG